MNIQDVNNLISLVAEVATEGYNSTYVELIIKKYNLDRKVEDHLRLVLNKLNENKILNKEI